MSHLSSIYYFERNIEKLNNNNKVLLPKIFNKAKLLNNNI